MTRYFFAALRRGSGVDTGLPAYSAWIIAILAIIGSAPASP